MPSFDLPPVRDDADLTPCVLEWDDARFTLKRANGEVLFETETSAAHRALDTVDLYVDSEIALTTPNGKLDLGKHRAAGAALRELVAKAAQSDREFCAKLEEQGQTGVRRGLRLIVASVIPMALHAAWTTADLPLPGGALKDVTYLLLTVPAIGLLAGLVALNYGVQARRLVARSLSSS